MIKARYSPSLEDLVEQVTEAMKATGAAPERRPVILNTIEILKDLGYDISIEVEAHGAIEAAFNSLKGDTSDYVLHQRPVRRVKI